MRVNSVRMGASRPADESITLPLAISPLDRRQSRRRSNRVNIREATISDAQAVFTFFLSQGKIRKEENNLWFKRWGLLFQLNPWLAGAVHHPIGWVVEEENGVIRGYAGNIILPYIYGGTVYKAACTTGILVDPAYRRYSMSMLKGYFTQTGIDIFMSSTANEISGTIFETLKIPKFPAENYNLTYYFFVSPWRVVYSFMRRRLPAFFARPIATLMGKILAFWFYIRDAVFMDRDNAVKGWKIIEKSLEDLDETYDAFWELIKSQLDQLILLKTKEALRWHFAGAGNWGAPVIFCYYEGDRMLGYAIIDKHLEKESGIIRFRCADLLTYGGKKDIIKRLMITAYLHAKREKADLFICYFLPFWIQKIVSGLAHLRRKRNGSVYIRMLNSELVDIDVGRKWYATCADGDAVFWSLTVPRT